MSLRTKWEFRFTPEAVICAATAKMQHHDQRRTFWQEEARTAEADLREHGIELRERPVTGGYNLHPMFDPEKMSRLEECKRKITEHQTLLDEYQAYIGALGSEGAPEEVALDVDDVKFFGL